MFYSRNLFDTIIIILCVTAGAKLHTIPNTSKSSFTNFILDTDFIELVRTSNMIQGNYIPNSTKHKIDSSVNSMEAKLQSQTEHPCPVPLSILNPIQTKFCIKHHDVLEVILPQISDLVKSECEKITSTFRWRCSSIEPFLKRSNFLAFTKEAALIRAILNASMMYLILKTCGDHSHRSCGCRSNHHSFGSAKRDFLDAANAFTGSGNDQTTSTHNVHLNSINHHIQFALPVKGLSRSMIQHQGCYANVAFADALTRLFLDSDDSRSLNKAYRILNDETTKTNYLSKNSGGTRQIDPDYKDISLIKWAKSAVNLHNNHFGRQVVREAIKTQCRCHGLSGACQFKTCWDKLTGFEMISSRLRSAYVRNSTKVEVKNIGTDDDPDLYLVRYTPPHENNPHNQQSYGTGPFLSSNYLDTVQSESINPNNMIYLYESPDYCQHQILLNHSGTRGRACKLRKSSDTIKPLSELASYENNEVTSIYGEDNNRSGTQNFGDCEDLCCDRGYTNELVFEFTKCNCKFRFCCRVECDSCLRQRLNHHCL